MSVSATQIHFSGKVQGVGFRASTTRVARELGLRGYVKNLKDGRVELVSADSAEQIDKLVDSLKERFGNGIQSIERSELKLESQPTDFEIIR